MSLLDWEKEKHGRVSLALVAEKLKKIERLRYCADRLAEAWDNPALQQGLMLDIRSDFEEALAAATENPFKVVVRPQPASNGLTYFVYLERTDWPKDSLLLARHRGYITPINRHNVEEANSEGYVWASFLGVPFTPCEKAEDTATRHTAPEYGVRQAGNMIHEVMHIADEYADCQYGEGRDSVTGKPRDKDDRSSDEVRKDLVALLQVVLMTGEAPPAAKPSLTGVVFRFD